MIQRSLTDRIRAVLVTCHAINSISRDTMFGLSPVERLKLTVRDVDGVEDVTHETTTSFTILTIRHAYDTDWNDVYTKISMAIDRLYK